jgi:hypothetical protein
VLEVGMGISGLERRDSTREFCAEADLRAEARAPEQKDLKRWVLYSGFRSAITEREICGEADLRAEPLASGAGESRERKGPLAVF